MDVFTPKAIIQRINRNYFKLVEDFEILLPNNTKIIIHTGFNTDLASIPKPLRSFISVIGNHVEASIVHDYLLETNILNINEINYIFYQLLLRYNVPKFSAYIMWKCVVIYFKIKKIYFKIKKIYYKIFNKEKIC